MCVLTILPEKGGGFILSSNRDESALRKAATAPEIRDVDAVKVMMPVDQEAGGTWLATSEGGRTAVLLNGAFERHKHEPPYRKSRGLVLLDSFSFAAVEDFYETYDLEGIEPFTLVSLDIDGKLSEIRWDGRLRFVTEVDSGEPHLWSSATLYPADVIIAREERFEHWLSSHSEYDVASIREYHKAERYDPVAHQKDSENKWQLQTVSITSLILKKDSSLMIYEDTAKGTVEEQELKVLTR